MEKILLILITMTQMTNDPKMLELIGMLREELESLEK